MIKFSFVGELLGQFFPIFFFRWPVYYIRMTFGDIVRIKP